jgi:sigma-54 dependent transcriptional regulator, acetoin dehydrogenase operon transcriptional activator AcoR
MTAFGLPGMFAPKIHESAFGNNVASAISRHVRVHRAQRTELDRAGALVGSDFAERAVGTNGLGSVIEERAPLLVRGGEHFIDALEEISCAGVPIFDPGSRRVRGSLSLTCAASKTHPMMLIRIEDEQLPATNDSAVG